MRLSSKTAPCFATQENAVDVNSIVTDVVLSVSSVLPENSRFKCRLSDNPLTVRDENGQLGSALYYLMMDMVLASQRRKQPLDITISSRRKKQNAKTKSGHTVILEIAAHGAPPDARPDSRDWRFVNETVTAEGGRLLVELKPIRRYRVEFPEAKRRPA